MSLAIEEIRLRCLEACKDGAENTDHMIHRAREVLRWVMEGQTEREAQRERVSMMDMLGMPTRPSTEGE